MKMIAGVNAHLLTLRLWLVAALQVHTVTSCLELSPCNTHCHKLSPCNTLSQTRQCTFSSCACATRRKGGQTPLTHCALPETRHTKACPRLYQWHMVPFVPVH